MGDLMRDSKTLQHGDKIEVYRNLHKKCFSLRKNGIVIKHLLDDEQLFIKDIKFVVRPAGRKKVLREKKKNVHAFVRGYYNAFPGENCVYPRFRDVVAYNPYRADTFMCRGAPKKTTKNVELKDGKVWILGDIYNEPI